jgi:DegV family protein with EDD domain
MSGISIMTDSTADLGPELVARYGVTVVPLAVVFGQDAYRDGVDVDTQRLFELVEQNKQLPKTSSPSPEVFRSVFEEVVADGGQALYIGISSRFSASVQNATLAAGTFPERESLTWFCTRATWSHRAGRWTRYLQRLRRRVPKYGHHSNWTGLTTCTWAEGVPEFRRCCHRC